MKMLVNGGNKVFDGDVIGLITELKEDSSFAELWNEAESKFDKTSSMLDLEAHCIIEMISFRLDLDHAITKQEAIMFLLEILG